jgi:hypothetical protein
MPENGGKTVDLTDCRPPAWMDWVPSHKGCSVVSRIWKGSHRRILVSWTKAPVKGLKRIEHFWISSEIGDTFDDQVEAHIDRIVHADSLKLLHRGPRSMRADAERFEAEQKLKGELCPA